MAALRTPPQTYVDVLMAGLNDIEATYLCVLDSATLVNVDPNRGTGSGIVLAGLPDRS